MIIELIKLSEGGVLSPSDIPNLIQKVRESISGEDSPLILSGRMPIWAMAALVSALDAETIATFDPRLGAGVIVTGDHPGDLMPIEGHETIKIEF